MKVYRLQPAPVVDGHAPDGSELTRLPYPFFVREDGGVESQEFWKGDPLRVLGFQRRLDVQRVDLHWADFVKGDGNAALRMYLVTQDFKGGVAAHTSPISEVNLYEQPEQVAWIEWQGDGSTRLTATEEKP